MYKTVTAIFVAFAFSLCVSSAAMADAWGCGEGLKSVIASLKLTDAQKKEIKPIMDHLESNIKDSINQIVVIESQINELTISEKMDQSMVNKLVDQKAKLIGDFMKAKIKATNQILVILAPDQKSKVLTMLRNKQEQIAVKYKRCHDDN